MPKKKKEGDSEQEPCFMPVIPLRGYVMFPKSLLNFEISRPASVRGVEKAIKTDQKVFIVSQKDLWSNSPGIDDLNTIGIVATLKQLVSVADEEGTKVVAEGLSRARALEYKNAGKYLAANVQIIEENSYKKSVKLTALERKAQKLLENFSALVPESSPDLVMGLKVLDDPSQMCDYIGLNVPFMPEDKQKILEELDVIKRLELVNKTLLSEIDIMQSEKEIDDKLKKSIDKGQREFFLREHLKVLYEELGEGDEPRSEALEYKEKIAKLKLPKESEEKLTKECDRFAKIPPGSSESHVMRSYIETCISLPWNKQTNDHIDIAKAQKILDKDHFGLKKVKERILEILAVRHLAKDIKGQIICLEGPPGVGKTSIVKSIAQAMGRKYVRVSLGGIKDEAEIRGHRRTYVGAMPGRIISAVKQSGVKNPLILLDEVDKISCDYYGDPSAALLEVLDPEQNNSFFDHYIDIPFDLSEALFITTANDSSQIPMPLYDRMEIINLYSYTHEEKFNIAKNHLIPRQLKRNGLNLKKFKIKDDALRMLIDRYTKEAGVRDLEKNIASLMRKSAKKIVSKDASSVCVDDKVLKEMLGSEKFKKNFKYQESEIGVVRGLAWTASGGETMPIEVSLMKGDGEVQITGSLGDVMKESAQIAVSYIRSNADKLGIAQDFHENTDIHIHVPEGATPKDGPSAGVTMTTALVSALSHVPVRQDVAMTGEVTLKGKVLAIGGLKEKSMAAYRDGVKTVIIPSENESDLRELDDVVKNSIKFITAENLDIVFKNSLDSGFQSKLAKSSEPLK